MSETTTLTAAELKSIIQSALEASRTSPENATSVARALAGAEIDGQKGHGLSRVPSYAAQSRSGKVDGFAKPVLRQTRPASLVVDAAHGFAYPAIDLAITKLPATANATGIAAAAITRSHHFGVAGHHVERLAEAGLIALAFSNTPSAMAAWGGRKGVFGTNPLAFAAPRKGNPPLVIDMALSQVARGKILTAAQKGEAIPEGWAVDADGQPTTDPKAAMKGSLVPIGGAKGAALALMVELLSIALTGGNFAYEASSFFDGEGPPPNIGQFLVAIDPAAFGGAEVFAARAEALFMTIEGDGARLPGMRRIKGREQATRDGVDVDAKLLADVRALAKQA